MNNNYFFLKLFELSMIQLKKEYIIYIYTIK